MSELTPEVIYLIDMGDEIVWCDDESPSGNEEDGVKYIRADLVQADYEARVIEAVRGASMMSESEVIQAIKGVRK